MANILEMKTIATLIGLLLSPLAYGEMKPLLPPVTPTYKTYVSIENVSEDMGLQLTLPDKKVISKMELGQRFEIPAKSIRYDAFAVVVQMVKAGYSFKACEISVDQMNQFDRLYVCTAKDIPNAQVQVRVFTDLHGGDKFRPRQSIARK